MRLEFLDRIEERLRLRRLCARPEGSLAVLYGRRRCGKSRLLAEALPARRTVHYVGDDRDDSLQRAALAVEIARLLPEFDQVEYPDWDALLARWWQAAPAGAVLVLDEFPALVAAARALPSLIQKYLDRHSGRRPHLILAGSSQRMMYGLFLDRAAPLYGRAREMLRIAPLRAGWIREALPDPSARAAVESFSVWGGIPRYWELAADHPRLANAVRDLVLSPLGVLHEEPEGLLRDDLRDTALAASLLSLVGRGCHRLSVIAARLEKPATSLSRPLQRLVDLELIRRDLPFGASTRDSKRTLYRIADPFLRFWFRFVEPNRSRLEAHQVDAVARQVSRELPLHTSSVWEDLARESVSALRCFGKSWKPARRWWGPGLDRKPLEIDLVAESADGRALLLGEARWSGSREAARLLSQLERKAANFPAATGRTVRLALWLGDAETDKPSPGVFGPETVLRALR